MARQPLESRRDQIIRAFQTTLVDFGYTTLTKEGTEVAIQQALRGEVSGNITARFIHGWLEDEFADLKPECEALFGKEE